MTFEFNGKVITKNRYVGAILMAIGMMVLSFISNWFMILVGETMAYFAPQWYEPGLLSPMFVEMWMGGVISLLGFLMMFGRKGSSFALNQTELEACAEKNQDKKDKIEAIIKLVNEYRLSEDHTLARAHITLYKIDMDILSTELENSIYSEND